MLNKNYRDEEKERIDAQLRSIMEMGHVPDEWEEIRLDLDRKLKEAVGIGLDEMENLPEEKLMEILANLDLEFSHYEALGDILLNSIELEAEEKQNDLAQKTLLIYKAAQEVSRTFSFSLTQKINEARSWIDD
jgi:tRNA G37 N-methylase Trm5